MNSLAQRVSEAINGSGVSVEKVADACGISVQAVYKWMNGATQQISGENLVELARLTNYEARWIIKGVGDKRKDPKAVAVCLAMEQMPEYKKDMIVQASNSLAKPTDQANNGTQ